MDVFKNLLLMLNYSYSQAKEGLLEVFPAVYCLKFPESIYTIKGIIPLQLISFSTNLLEVVKRMFEKSSKSSETTYFRYSAIAKIPIHWLTVTLFKHPLSQRKQNSSNQ